MNHFLAKHATPAGRVRCISPEALLRLQEYDFPGNVRELENIVERSLAMCGESDVQISHLPAEFGHYQAINIPNVQPSVMPTKSFEENEREYILAVLKNLAGNKTQAAKVIGIDRVSLWRKLKRYKSKGFDVDEYLQKKS